MNRGVTIEGASLRVPALGLLGVGAVLPLLDHPGPGCLLRATTGVPCPLCGMSTSVTSTMRGDLSDAIAAAPAGVLVVVLALLVAATGRPRRFRVPLPGVVGVLAVMWVFQLFRFSIL